LMTFHGADKQGEWYADGRPTRFNHYMDFMGSRCFLEGNATCISCHEGHSSQNDSLLIVPLEQSNRLCLNCHQEKYGGTKLTQHTFHLPDSPGSRCYACHMGESLERVMMHRRDHSMDNPLPENTIKYGIPNTCNNRGCHADKTPEWAVRTLDQWYGSANRQKVLYATEAMWRARTGDEAVIPDLIRAANDPNLRITMRASAVSALGNYFGPKAESSVPALLGLLSETREVYRRPFQVAVAQALGFIGDRRGVDPLVGLLDSPHRVVRLTAAFSLLNFGVVKLDGEAGARLARAQGEYVQALRNWPDVPEFKLNLGSYWVLMKNYKEAIVEYQGALRLNPELPDAYYYGGRAYAYLGQFKEAVSWWKKARELRPGFRDVDRLIEAGEKAIKGQ
jgi:predicted CXXCH cytochrome family protein